MSFLEFFVVFFRFLILMFKLFVFCNFWGKYFFFLLYFFCKVELILLFIFFMFIVVLILVLVCDVFLGLVVLWKRLFWELKYLELLFEDVGLFCFCVCCLDFVLDKCDLIFILIRFLSWLLFGCDKFGFFFWLYF